MYDFHITLKQMAYIEESQLGEIKRKLDAIFNELPKNQPKIKLTFDKLVPEKGDLGEENGHIYIFSDSIGKLNDLQQKTRTGLKKYSDYCNPKSHDYEYDFKAHITIARNLNATKFKEAISEIKDDFGCEGEVTELILSCVKEISLGESKNPDNLTIYKY